MRLDQLEQLRVDRRPDRARAVGRRGRRAGVGARLAHVLERDDHLEVELLRAPRVDELDRAAAGDEPADLLERALRRRERDPLERLPGQALEPLERERHVRAALRAGDRVHLVEDHRADAAERLPRPRGEEQEERLGGGDQDVGRVPEHLRRAPSRGVSPVRTPTESGELDAGQRPAQVPLDVVVERLERRDVEHLRPSPASARSRAQRKAASVFPEPVGAWISVLEPVAMTGQPRSCAGVGASNVRANQSRVAGLKEASGSTPPD